MPEQDEHSIITDKLNEILKILNGNGKIGLCAKVSLMWSWGVVIIGAVAVNLIKSFLF